MVVKMLRIDPIESDGFLAIDKRIYELLTKATLLVNSHACSFIQFLGSPFIRNTQGWNRRLAAPQNWGCTVSGIGQCLAASNMNCKVGLFRVA